MDLNSGGIIFTNRNGSPRLIFIISKKGGKSSQKINKQNANTAVPVTLGYPRAYARLPRKFDVNVTRGSRAYLLCIPQPSRGPDGSGFVSEQKILKPQFQIPTSIITLHFFTMNMESAIFALKVMEIFTLYHFSSKNILSDEMF